MNEKEEDLIKEVQLLDSDLYEEDYIISEENSEPKNSRKNYRKIFLTIVAFLLFITVVGPLTETINMSTISFLKKSYKLSQRDDIQDYKEATVTIKAEDRKGTGFNTSSTGIIITNYHVVKDEDKAIVSFPNGPTETASVINKYPEIDIAILKMDNQSALPYLNLDMNQTLMEEEHVYFIGNPLMFNQIANEGEIIGATNNTSLKTPVILLDAPVYKGNSGSPVINKDGNVLGVIYAKGTVKLNGEKKNVGFIIPIQSIPNLK